MLKAIWSNPWTTGKLSDLAWVIFASPLLAFILSLLTRRSRLAQRAAFVATHADFGLPGRLGVNARVRAATAGGGFPAVPPIADLPALADLPVGGLDVLERSGAYRYGRWGTLWLPPGVAPDSAGYKWRQVAPEVPGCHRFAAAGTSGGVPFPADPLAARLNRDGGYGWQLWRRYACCANPCRVRVAGPLRIELGG